MIIDEAALEGVIADNVVPQRLLLALLGGFRCGWCGRALRMANNLPRSATIEHLLPQGHPDRHRLASKIAACLRCNALRGSLPAQWFAHLVALYGARLPERGSARYVVLQRSLHRLAHRHAGSQSGSARSVRLRIPAPTRRVMA